MKGNDAEVMMKMRRKLLNQDAKRGTQEKREGANTNTSEPGPKRANPERAREKKNGGRRTRNKTSGGGGRTEAPKPTYHSETYAYLSTRRTQPTCREENT